MIKRYLVIPEKLSYGEYALVEVQAPYGCLLNHPPTSFSVTQDNTSSELGLIVITINAFDLPQKGVINITKTDGYHFVLKYSFYLYFYKNIILIISFDFSLLIEAAFKFIAYNNACKSS